MSLKKPLLATWRLEPASLVSVNRHAICSRPWHIPKKRMHQTTLSLPLVQMLILTSWLTLFSLHQCSMTKFKYIKICCCSVAGNSVSVGVSAQGTVSDFQCAQEGWLRGGQHERAVPVSAQQEVPRPPPRARGRAGQSLRGRHDADLHRLLHLIRRIGAAVVRLLHLIRRTGASDPLNRCIWSAEQMHLIRRTDASDPQNRCIWSAEQMHLIRRTDASDPQNRCSCCPATAPAAANMQHSTKL